MLILWSLPKVNPCFIVIFPQEIIQIADQPPTQKIPLIFQQLIPGHNFYVVSIQ